MKIDYKILALIILFVLGMYYYMNSSQLYESLDNKEPKINGKKSTNSRCPNMLIEKDGSIYLYNSKLAIVPGVNPIQFKNLEEYSEFVDWQSSQNLNCPVLYLQYTTDTQNNELVQVKSSIFENQGGLPNEKSNTLSGGEDDEYYEKNKMLDATRNSTPDPTKKLNTGMYSGFDQYNQNVGLDTPLDKLFSEKNSKSANPMDTHWGGKKHTQQKLEEGDYKDRYVYKHLG